jgi:hypothetical protein
MADVAVEDKDQKPDPVIELTRSVQAMQKQFGDAMTGIRSQLQAQQQQIAAVVPKPKLPDKKPIHETFLVDEEAALTELKEQAKSEAKAEIKDELQREGRMANVVSSLRAEWPELSDNDSPMTQATLKNFGSLPKHEQTPAAMELSAIRAAQALDLQPKSKRAAPEEDDFVVGKASGSQQRERKSKEGKTADGIDQKTADFATLLGRDPKKVKEYADRGTWGKYRGKGEK